MTQTPRLLLFGATGAIGNAILKHVGALRWQITAVGRRVPAEANPAHTWIETDPLGQDFSAATLGSQKFDAVCWAQGMNVNDNVFNVSTHDHMELYKANCIYILVTLQALLTGNLLEHGSRLCVISSIWQNLARQSKLSYCMSKAALQGLVLSASVDLASEGHLINAVLPGALDTPMTHKNLSPEQISKLQNSTGFNALPKLSDVASTVAFLCSPDNAGITGQFIAVDLGYSHARFV